MKTMYSTHSRKTTPVKVYIVGDVEKHGVAYKQCAKGKLYRPEWLHETAAKAYQVLNAANQRLAFEKLKAVYRAKL